MRPPVRRPTRPPSPSGLRRSHGSLRRLIDAGKILGIRMLDHVVCGRPIDTSPGYVVSLREKGLVAFD